MNSNKKISTVFLYPSYICNDNCEFCFFQNKNKTRQLSIENVSVGLEYLYNKFKFDSLVLAGGEPTICQDFYRIIDLIFSSYRENQKIISFHLATNAISFSNSLFADKFLKFSDDFKKHNNIIDLSISTINLCKNNNKKIGIERLAKENVNLNFILVFTKKNFNGIENILEYVVGLKKSRKRSNSLFRVELRFPFLFEHLPKIENSLFEGGKIKSKLRKIRRYLENNNIEIKYRNIPLCYVLRRSELEKFIKIRNNPRFSMLELSPENYDSLELIRPESFLSSVEKSNICEECLLKNSCSGIDEKYLVNKNFPRLKVIK